MADELQRDQSPAHSTATTEVVPQPDEVYRPADEDTISLLDLIAVLFRHKWLIIGATGLAAIGVLTYSIISLVLPPEKSPMPNYFKAEALVLINEESGTSLRSVLGNSNLSGLAGLAGVGGAGGTSNGELALSLVKSRTILDQMADEFNIVERYEIEESPKAKSRQVLRDMLTTELTPETGILSVAVQHMDPEFARDVANRFVEILDSRFRALGVDQNRSRANLLEQKIEEVNREITQLEGEIANFQREYGAFSVESLVEEQVTMRGRIRSDLLLKEIEISTYEEFSNVNDPALQRLRAERDNLRDLLREMNEGYSEFEGRLPSQQELPELAARFARLEREAQAQEQIYSTLRQQYELAQLSLEGEERTFQILERAEAPDQKAGPSRAMLSIITTITAFFLSVFLAFVLEYFSRVSEDEEESQKLDEIKSHLPRFLRGRSRTRR
ncbi:MAG: GNVR domain-containing protein [Alkalispirochaeta sp.]